jgi:hypothetical protein
MTNDLLGRLHDLHRQATVERSHFYVGKCVADAMHRIEELETEIKLLSEGATIAHLRGAMDAHANRADDIWAEFKDKFDGERKYALRQIVKWLKGEK